LRVSLRSKKALSLEERIKLAEAESERRLQQEGLQTEREKTAIARERLRLQQDFERDRIECTPKKKSLDETCLRDKGWLPLSGDVGPAVKAPSIPVRQKGNKY